MVGLLGLSLLPIAAGLDQPYKTDFRGLISYLTTVQAAQPNTRFTFLGRDAPGRWTLAVDDPSVQREWITLIGGATRHRRAGSYPGRKARRSGPEIVTYYHGVAPRHLDREAAALIKQLGPDSCRQIPMYALIVVRCD